MSSEFRDDSHLNLPSLPTGWAWRRLSELVNPERGICYGIVQPGKHDQIGIPMVNSGDIQDGSVAATIDFRVSSELHNKFRRSTLRGGELLITLVGANFGRVAIAPSHYAGYNCARPVGVVPLLEDAEYVMFVLRSPLTRRFMDTWANTTAQPTLNLTDLGDLPIPLPPAQVRERIKDVLKVFDERIALLRETNATLENIAQALFKSWFVDFDPVRAKQQGFAPEGMDEATAALFPSTMSETGGHLIPLGWVQGTFGDVLKETSKRVGASPAVVLSAVQTGELVRSDEHFNKRVHSESIEKYKAVPPLAFAYNPSRINIGSIGLNDSDRLGAVSPVYVVATSKSVGSAYLIWHHLRTGRVRGAISTLATGTVRQSLSFSDFASISLIIPDSSVIDAFLAQRNALYLRVRMNTDQAQTLATIRDSLLPPLISGRLPLLDTDKIEPESLLAEVTA